MEPYYLDSDDEDDKPLSFKRSRSGLPIPDPSTTVNTLAANASATTVQENDTTEEQVLVEDNDDMEDVVEDHNEFDGEDDTEAESDGGDGQGEQMEDGENRTDQEDGRNRGQASSDGDMVANDANSVNSAGLQGTMAMFGKFTDPDVLDCPICFEALTVPVFQCDNGHLQCSSCCMKIGNECPTCSFPIGNKRCRSIERILNSVYFACRNVLYGCKEGVIHSEREVHEKACIFEPCCCPLERCDFVGSQKKLYAHFRGSHSSSAIQFDYRRPFNLILEDKNNSVILQEKTDGTIFILNHEKNSVPHAINLIAIGVLHTKEVFCYELSVEYEGSTLKFNSFAAITRKWPGSQPLRKYLLVPSDFVSSNGSISVSVCIEKRRQ